MLIIQNGRVIDPKTGMDKVMDILIDEGKIAAMGQGLTVPENAQCLDAAGLVIAPGLVDVHVHFRDPGFTYKEDIQTGAAAAAAGGFTTVVCMANTNPVVDNAETMKYLRREAAKAPIHVLNTAAISCGFKGQQLTPMAELKALGAVGFTDDGVPLADTSLVMAAMEEAKVLNVPLSFHEEDPALIGSFGINQGRISQAVQVKGAPAVAEDVLVARDCALALATGAKVSIQHISSGTSVEIIRAMKALGGQIYAEATPQHFSLTEEAVLEKGTLAKVNPPIRTAWDQQKIIEGLQDNTIEIIATDHAPHSAEEKAKDMAHAPSGMIGLETSLALGITNLVDKGYLSLSQLLEKMTINPAKFYGLDAGYVAENGPADLTVFDPEAFWEVRSFKSKSANSPFIGETLKGQVKYTICRGQVVYKS